MWERNVSKFKNILISNESYVSLKITKDAKDTKAFFNESFDTSPKVDGYCEVNGKPSDTELLHEVLEEDRPPTEEVLQLLRQAAKKSGLTDEEIAHVYR